MWMLVSLEPGEDQSRCAENLLQFSFWLTRSLLGSVFREETNVPDEGVRLLSCDVLLKRTQLTEIEECQSN